MMQKLKLSSVLLLFILILTACSDSEIPESAETIEKFKTAIFTENLDEIESSLSPDEDVTVDSVYLKQMVSHFKKEPEEFSNLITLLYAQQSLLDEEANSYQQTDLLLCLRS